MNKDQRLPKPQIIQPYYFGDEYQKTTCLWLSGIPELFHRKQDHVSKGEFAVFKSGKRMPKWYAETPSTGNEANRAIRSKTFPGIANAMAEQWGHFLLTGEPYNKEINLFSK